MLGGGGGVVGRWRGVGGVRAISGGDAPTGAAQGFEFAPEAAPVAVFHMRHAGGLGGVGETFGLNRGLLLNQDLECPDRRVTPEHVRRYAVGGDEPRKRLARGVARAAGPKGSDKAS